MIRDFPVCRTVRSSCCLKVPSLPSAFVSRIQNWPVCARTSIVYNELTSLHVRKVKKTIKNSHLGHYSVVELKLRKAALGSKKKFL